MCARCQACLRSVACQHFLPLWGLSPHFLHSMNAILKPSNTERRIPGLPLILRVSRQDVGSDLKSEPTLCGLGQVSSASGPPVMGGSERFVGMERELCLPADGAGHGLAGGRSGGRQGRRCPEGPL